MIRLNMNLLGGVFDDVLEVVKYWKPKSQYSNEEGFRDDLIEFLRKNLGKGSILAPSRTYSIQKEAGRSLADIGIDRSVGIELKFNLTKRSQSLKLIGQVKDYLKDYNEGVIVVLCGKTDPDKEDHVRTEVIDFNQDRLTGNGKRVVVVKKEEHPKEIQEPSNNSIYGFSERTSWTI